MNRYGNKLAQLREKRGLTQEELAKKLGLTRAALSHYETGRREPDYDTLKNFADFFDVTVDFLLGRTVQANSTLDPDVAQFVDALELSDEDILNRFTLTIDGRKLTAEEAKRFIAFVRAERSMD